MQYTNRISAFEDEITYTLDDEGIKFLDGVIYYNDVKDVTLKYQRSRYHTNIYHCELRSDNAKLILSNRKYVKLATFEYQSTTYCDFVQSMHNKLSSETTEFHAGMPRVRFWAEFPIALSFFTVILLTLFDFGGPFVAGVFLLLIAFRLTPYYFGNYHKEYVGSSIPKYILPKT